MNAFQSGFGFGRKKRIQPGDGHQLKPFRPWQLLSRSLFYAPLESDDGTQQTYAVHVDYFNLDEKADVYLDGKHHLRAKLPAKIPVEGGEIEVATSTYGLKRMHYVNHAGAERVLLPDPASAEGLRARFAKRSPALSRAIGVIAVVVLLALLPIGLLQLAELVSHTEFAQDYVDPFTSPIQLPDWTETPLLILGIAAATERALTLRNHWLIDLDTGWFE